MEGVSVTRHIFSKKKQVTNLASSVYVSVDSDRIEIDPQQLYQRLLVAGIGNIDKKTLSEHELCSYPCSLFGTKLLMRLADKADLQNGLVKKAPQCIANMLPFGIRHRWRCDAAAHSLAEVNVICRAVSTVCTVREPA